MTWRTRSGFIQFCFLNRGKDNTYKFWYPSYLFVYSIQGEFVSTGTVLFIIGKWVTTSLSSETWVLFRSSLFSTKYTSLGANYLLKASMKRYPGHNWTVTHTYIVLFELDPFPWYGRRLWSQEDFLVGHSVPCSTGWDGGRLGWWGRGRGLRVTCHWHAEK